MRVTVVGAGNVGRSIAKELIGNGHHVMLIDKDPKAIKMDSRSASPVAPCRRMRNCKS